MLWNEKYRGEFIYGKTRHRKLSDGTETRDAVPEAEWTRIQRDDLRIIDNETGAAAHERLKTTHDAYLKQSNGRLIGKPELVSKRLLAGFLVCGTCKSPMTVDPRWFRGKKQPAYVCGNRRLRGTDACSNSHALRAADRLKRLAPRVNRGKTSGRRLHKSSWWDSSCAFLSVELLTTRLCLLSP
jgi:hypothetical protein